MTQLARDRVHRALTRPQMFAGVTYSVFSINGIVTTEVFLITRSFWAFGVAAGGPDFGRGIDIQLHIGVWRDYRTDIAPVEHRTMPDSEIPLKREQGQTDSGDRRDLTCSLVRWPATKVRTF